MSGTSTRGYERVGVRQRPWAVVAKWRVQRGQSSAGCAVDRRRIMHCELPSGRPKPAETALSLCAQHMSGRRPG